MNAHADEDRLALGPAGPGLGHLVDAMMDNGVAGQGEAQRADNRALHIGFGGAAPVHAHHLSDPRLWPLVGKGRSSTRSKFGGIGASSHRGLAQDDARRRISVIAMLRNVGQTMPRPQSGGSCIQSARFRSRAWAGREKLARSSPTPRWCLASGFLRFQPAAHGAAPVIDLAPKLDARRPGALCVPAPQRVLGHPEADRQIVPTDPVIQQADDRPPTGWCPAYPTSALPSPFAPDCGQLRHGVQMSRSRGEAGRHIPAKPNGGLASH